MLAVFGEGSPVDRLLTGALVASGSRDGAHELLLRTEEDAQGLFGPRIRVILDPDPDGPADPLASGFLVTDAALSVTTPVSLPAVAALLLAALGAGGAAG